MVLVEEAMNTMTIDECLCQSMALQDIYQQTATSPWWKELMSFFFVADASDKTIANIRAAFDECSLPISQDGCVPRLLSTSRQLALDFSRMASHPMVFFLGQRKNMLRVSEGWELLAEDLELVDSAEKRQAWSDLAVGAGEAAAQGKLKDWRESGLFQ